MYAGGGLSRLAWSEEDELPALPFVLVLALNLLLAGFGDQGGVQPATRALSVGVAEGVWARRGEDGGSSSREKAGCWARSGCGPAEAAVMLSAMEERRMWEGRADSGDGGCNGDGDCGCGCGRGCCREGGVSVAGVRARGREKLKFIAVGCFGWY